MTPLCLLLFFFLVTVLQATSNNLYPNPLIAVEDNRDSLQQQMMWSCAEQLSLETLRSSEGKVASTGPSVSRTNCSTTGASIGAVEEKHQQPTPISVQQLVQRLLLWGFQLNVRAQSSNFFSGTGSTTFAETSSVPFHCPTAETLLRDVLRLEQDNCADNSTPRKADVHDVRSADTVPYSASIMIYHLSPDTQQDDRMEDDQRLPATQDEGLSFPLNLTRHDAPPLSSATRSSDCDLLAQFYLETTKEERRWNRIRWNTSTDCCLDGWDGITCNVAGSQVTQIDLHANGIVGTLPREWVKMTSLASLVLYSNALTGTLPAEWGNMTSLEGLYLNDNSLTGSLPPEWANMSSIGYLILYLNALTGTLPSEWSRLSSLMILNLDTNALTGTLPNAWGNLTFLLMLDLSTNIFTGTLPSAWGSMIFLVWLDLSENAITGTLPVEWRTMMSMQRLGLAENLLTGTLPSEWEI